MNYDDICALYGLFSVRLATVSGICCHFVYANGNSNFHSSLARFLFIEVSGTRLGARMWSILGRPVWADGGCCERDSIRSLLLYTLCSVFF